FSPLLLLISTVVVYGSPTSLLACLDLLHKVVFRNSTKLEGQDLVKCFLAIPTLRDTDLSLPEDIDVKDFSTVGFNEFAKVARGRATPRQIAHLPHSGWDIVAALRLLKENDRSIEIPLNVPVLRPDSSSTLPWKRTHWRHKNVQ
ncbi:hypothetical protein PENTCL1PPCAC_4504, partial [Pristionchus entomophagus]